MGRNLNCQKTGAGVKINQIFFDESLLLRSKGHLQSSHGLLDHFGGCLNADCAVIESLLGLHCFG